MYLWTRPSSTVKVSKAEPSKRLKPFHVATHIVPRRSNATSYTHRSPRPRPGGYAVQSAPYDATRPAPYGGGPSGAVAFAWAPVSKLVHRGVGVAGGAGVQAAIQPASSTSDGGARSARINFQCAPM